MSRFPIPCICTTLVNGRLVQAAIGIKPVPQKKAILPGLSIFPGFSLCTKAITHPYIVLRPRESQASALYVVQERYYVWKCGDDDVSHLRISTLLHRVYLLEMIYVCEDHNPWDCSLPFLGRLVHSH